MFRPIDPTSFDPAESEFNPGPAPQLNWLEISTLVVDPSYQREIGRRGQGNIRAIAETFEWSKFAPVIVAPIEGGQYAIVDGQHRTTAAAIRGIEKVPCQIVQADRAKQAQAYAAVNGAITKTTPQQLFHAQLAAKDPASVELAEVCATGGVEIVRKNTPSAYLKVGQTLAVAALRTCLRTYGRDILITALQCITQTSDGNPGWVRATIVESLCAVLDSSPEWREGGSLLLQAMDDFDFADMWEEIMAGRNFVLSPATSFLLSGKIADHLRKKLGPPIRAAAE